MNMFLAISGNLSFGLKHHHKYSMNAPFNGAFALKSAL